MSPGHNPAFLVYGLPLGSSAALKLPLQHHTDTEGPRNTMGCFREPFHGEEGFIRASVEVLAFPGLSVPVYFGDTRLIHIVPAGHAREGTGLGILSWCQERAGASVSELSQGPHFLIIETLKISPCTDVCCGLEQWQVGTFTALLSLFQVSLMLWCLYIYERLLQPKELYFFPWLPHTYLLRNKKKNTVFYTICVVELHGVPIGISTPVQI